MPKEEDSVLVLNGDIITSQAPGAVLETYRRSKSENSSHRATIMIVPMVSPYGLVNTNEDDNVIGFREKVELPYWVNAGIYMFDRSIAPELPDLGDHEVETFPRLAQSGQMSALKSRCFWRSIDSFKDLRETEEYVSGAL
jgi:NDP-sugar pyrophosphorylase family protein